MKPAHFDRYKYLTCWEFCHAPGGHQSHSPRCRRYGAYLLRDTTRVTRIVGTLASALRVPVTAPWPGSRIFTCIGRIKAIIKFKGMLLSLCPLLFSKSNLHYATVDESGLAASKLIPQMLDMFDTCFF